MRNEIINENGKYIVKIYNDNNEVIILQDKNIFTGTDILTYEDAELIANELLKEFEDVKILEQIEKIKILYEETIKFILNVYPEEKRQLDINTKEYQINFLISNKNLQYEEVIKIIFDAAKAIFLKNTTLDDILLTFEDNVYPFAINPEIKVFETYSDFTTIILEPFIVSNSFNLKILTHDGIEYQAIINNNEIIIDNTTIGYIDLINGIINITTQDTTNYAKIEITYKTYYTINEREIQKELIEVAISIGYAQNIKAIYTYYKNKILNNETTISIEEVLNNYKAIFEQT